MAHKENFVDSNGTTKVLNRRFHKEATKRYRVNSLDDLLANEAELLLKLISHHRKIQVPRLIELQDYANGNNHSIIEGQRRNDEDMSDNRAIHDYGRIISNFKQGFLTGIPILVNYVDEVTNEVLLDIANENDFNELNRAIVQDLSKLGRSYDIVYRLDDDKTRIRKLDPKETFVIFDMTLSEHSIAAVRYFNINPYGDKEEIRVELYTDTEIRYYTLNNSDLVELEDERSKHAFNDVPITEYLNNLDGMGDYESVLSLIDLYDAAQSDTANYMTDLSDAILAITGLVEIEGTDTDKVEEMKKMRQARLMHLEPPKNNDGTQAGEVHAEYLYKQYDVAGTEAYKDRIENNIHKITSTPDLSDTKFAGTQSGEAMKYKLFGLELESDNTITRFTKSIKRRYELVATIEELAGTINEFDLSDLSVKFTPNLPKSLTEQIENFVSLNGQVTNETAMELTGIVHDPIEEVKKLSETESNSLLRRLERNRRMSDSEMFEGVADGQDE